MSSEDIGRASNARWICDRRGRAGLGGGGIAGRERKPPVYWDVVLRSRNGGCDEERSREETEARLEAEVEIFLKNGIFDRMPVDWLGDDDGDAYDDDDGDDDVEADTDADPML